MPHRDAGKRQIQPAHLDYPRQRPSDLHTLFLSTRHDTNRDRHVFNLRRFPYYAANPKPTPPARPKKLRSLSDPHVHSLPLLRPLPETRHTRPFTLPRDHPSFRISRRSSSAPLFRTAKSKAPREVSAGWQPAADW